MRTKLIKKALMTVGVAVLVCGFSMQASAITFTQQSGFNVLTGELLSNGGTSSNTNDIRWYAFSSPTPAPPADTVATDKNPAGSYFNTIAWGRANNNGGLMTDSVSAGDRDPFGAYGNNTPLDNNTGINFSGLRVIGYTGDAVEGDWTRISTIYHQNNPIAGDLSTLLSAKVYSELQVGSTDYHSLTLNFTETSNDGYCEPEGAPNGSNCDDLFKFTLSGFNPVTFNYGGKLYNAEFNLGNFDNAKSNFPGDTGATWYDGTHPAVTVCDTNGENCETTVTVWTAEKQKSSMDIFMRLTAVSVPEPATLTLLGLGLLGLGFAKRRRKNG